MRARRWLEASHDYIAPDLLFPEAGNAIWKKVRREELTQDEGQRLVMDLSRVAVEAVSMRGLLPDAHALAVTTGITVYDATYLTLAVRLETQVITGDDRFARKLADHPLLAPYVSLGRGLCRIAVDARCSLSRRMAEGDLLAPVVPEDWVLQVAFRGPTGRRPRATASGGRS